MHACMHACNDSAVAELDIEHIRKLPALSRNILSPQRGVLSNSHMWA